MSDLTLYRKYRPQKFKDVVGQDHIISVLEGGLEQGKTAHAYLFVGSRGTGKTSLARILARELGCQTDDLVEIDAASNRRVEEARELREGINTLPFRSPVKVYIIDEVHMLTREAFNTLLKTLEEPPAHVVFILATTDFHKVPETIVSRCEVHTFHKPSDEVLVEVVKKIAKKEGYEIDKDGANFVALLGDGSFRDTLGHLQKVMSFSKDKNISTEEIAVITGAPALQTIRDSLGAILDKDLERALLIVHDLVENNRDIKIFIKLLLREVRLAMLLSFAPELGKKLLADISKSEADFLTEAKTHANARFLPAVLRDLLEAYDLSTYSTVPSLPLELALIKILGNKE
jgi:DNA polymerase III subunit gamma/tau